MTEQSLARTEGVDPQFRREMIEKARAFMQPFTRKSYWYVLPFWPDTSDTPNEFIGHYWCDYGRSDKNDRGRVAADQIAAGFGALIVHGEELA